MYQSLPGIRAWIFQNGTGSEFLFPKILWKVAMFLKFPTSPDVSQLLHDILGYGSYQTLGNLSVALNGVNEYTNYTRRLDLDTGVHTSSWNSKNVSFQTSVFCSYPALSCVYTVTSNAALPIVHVSMANNLMNSDLINVTCGEGYTRLAGVTQASIGLRFDSIARVSGRFNTTCLPATGSLMIAPAPSQTTVSIVFSAESDYEETRGNANSNYSFRGLDPGPIVEARTTAAASQSYEDLLRLHIADYSSLKALFILDLPDSANSSAVETAELVARYTANPTDPFLESLMFEYSQHLLISSSREGSLPANLQGRWTEQLEPAWSGDYHANINLQMSYWGAQQTGMGELSRPLFEYMANTWAPRGSETAQLLYNGSGWVAHDEMNIFGYTGMKDEAQWADCECRTLGMLSILISLTSISQDPASAAWIMQEVFDHYDYTGNLTWLSEIGYPLLKGIASFWLSQLQEDLFYNDGTLVVNPCNSPEQGPTTFGCTHYQQLLHQVFEATLATAPLVSDPDSAFVDAVSDKMSRLDTGIHIDPDSDTGVLKEWKVPDRYLYNIYPQHRHISHLVGWFPGYSISSFSGGYVNATLQNAVRASLIARGNGTDADGDGGDYGWPKVWRGACWARLNDSSRAYEELQLTIANNVAPNLLSMYAGKNAPFQIDMNFGWAGNVLSMLVVDLPMALSNRKQSRTVVLGPAIPVAWGNGSVKGLRVRGGMVVDFQWDECGIVTQKTVVSGDQDVLFVNVQGGDV